MHGKYFSEGLQKLGFAEEINEFLFQCNQQEVDTDDVEIRISLRRASEFGASAVFFRKELDKFKPQIFLYDFTDRTFDEANLANIHRKVWSSGEVPLVCAFYNTEIKILNCSHHVESENKPVYLAHLDLTIRAHRLYNEEFAVKVKTGEIWDENELKNKFNFNSSAYDILIRWIKDITQEIIQANPDVSNSIVKKIIVQSIMIKYLEERKDEYGNSPFNLAFFRKYGGAESFTDVLANKELVDLLDDLNNHLSGNIFLWGKEEKLVIREINLLNLITALRAYQKPEDTVSPNLELLRYYEFAYIPIELISRIYEEFLAGNDDSSFSQKEKKQKEGIFYTPSHLAKLLVDQCMPLKDYKKVDLNSYKVLDPACGSGIFLVLAFKRLVQWWRLQNDFIKPTVEDLKSLLNNIYGVDKELQATKLAAFSLCLALCDELSPKQIIQDLQFNDLTQDNILHADFFIDEIHASSEAYMQGKIEIQKENFRRLNKNLFNLILGNPPFDRGAIKNYSSFWRASKKVRIPQGQIALKFLTESLRFLKPGGLQCLIIKSSGLLYNSTSIDFKKVLFSTQNILQVFDFTALARNRTLWDNGADVAAAAIFLRKEMPDFSKNILHLVFRRTRALKDRLNFEIDEYDFHFIGRQEAIDNPFVWKANFLGGGRIKNIINKTRNIGSFQNVLDNTFCRAAEGLIGSNGKHRPSFLSEIPFLPTEKISDSGIDYSGLKTLEENLFFVKVPSEETFTAPNVLLWENVGTSRLPVFFNEVSFSFRHQIIGVKGPEEMLKSIVEEFRQNSEFYRFYMFTTSSYLLINRNTAILKEDYMRLPFLMGTAPILSEIDHNIIQDVNNYMQSLIRNGEKSILLEPIKSSNLKDCITNYGKEFSRLLNHVYKQGEKLFRLDQVHTVHNESFIITVFKYDTQLRETRFSEVEVTEEDIDILTSFGISRRLSSKRILRIYDRKDTIIIVKPNRLRYWISLMAYRDADKGIVDLANSGY